MTPQRMAALHRLAFAHDRPWTPREYADLTQSAHVRTYADTHGFALTRTLAGESELLTLAVDPAHRRQGIARTLLMRWLTEIQSEAETAFLEVAADNPGAIALYDGLGFVQTATRPRYYLRAQGPAIDALIMARTMTLGQSRDS